MNIVTTYKANCVSDILNHLFCELNSFTMHNCWVMILRFYGISVLQYFRPSILRTILKIGPTTAVGWMYILFCLSVLRRNWRSCQYVVDSATIIEIRWSCFIQICRSDAHTFVSRMHTFCRSEAHFL